PHPFAVRPPPSPAAASSGPPAAPGMQPDRIAALWTELMDGLGYRRFGAQGGDWGAMVTTYLGAKHADRVVGIHLNLIIAFPEDRKNPPMDGVTQEEIADLMRMPEFLREETGYQRI